MLGALIASRELAALGPEHERTKRLAAALANVQRHYSMPSLDPGKMALAMLAWTAGTTYFPVLREVANKRKGEAPPPAGNPAAFAQPDRENVQVGPWFTPSAQSG